MVTSVWVCLLGRLPHPLAAARPAALTELDQTGQSFREQSWFFQFFSSSLILVIILLLFSEYF